ncbi:MAG: McrC family protein [Acidimicrobiales bacterium]
MAVKASSYVGTVVSPDLRILITPKVATANLFHMLEAEGQSVVVGAETFDYERTKDLVPSFATFYARHLEIALARGLPHEYREREERQLAIRGRVNLPAQRRAAGLPFPIECRFDEYTGDVQLNRILRGAATRLLCLPGVTATARQALRQLAGRLEEAGDLTAHDLQSPTVFTRLSDHYRPAERLARIVLGDASLLDAAGTTGAGVFLVDMNRVFEKFVEARLRRYLARRFVVRDQYPARLDVGGFVGIKPDLVFKWAAGGIAYVADSKYKLTSEGLGRESDYYQLLAYTAALELSEGLLIYCQVDGLTPPREIDVGQLRTRLCTWAVRLDRSPAHVEQEMQRLADYVVERTLRRDAVRVSATV